MSSFTVNGNTVTIRPSMWQFVINELPMLLLAISGFCYCGCNDMPLQDLVAVFSTLLSLCLFYRYQWLRRLVYRVTGEQLIIHKGVFTRCCDYIELYRVVDFHEHKSFMQQIIGLKTVSIYSGDRMTPRLDIIGVHNKMHLVDIIRDRVEWNRQRKGIYEITNR